MVLFGLWARVGASIIAINMTDAIVLVHTGDFMKLNQTGGWELELQAMFLATAMAAALFGPELQYSRNSQSMELIHKMWITTARSVTTKEAQAQDMARVRQ